MNNSDDEDSDELGRIGYMSDEMTTEAPFWRLVCSLRLSPSEIDRWTLDEMRKACAFLTMQNDYKRIWSVFYNRKTQDAENEAERGELK